MKKKKEGKKERKKERKKEKERKRKRKENKKDLQVRSTISGGEINQIRLKAGYEDCLAKHKNQKTLSKRLS